MSKFVLWGLTASPYCLKMISLLNYHNASRRQMPDSFSLLKFWLIYARLQRLKSRGKVRRFGGMKQGMDEYPAVPFYTPDGKTFYYDSTGLAWHLDSLETRETHPLIPKQPELRFVAQLLDEAVDEFGLYMVHHHRWVTSAATNTMGRFTAKEMKVPSFLIPLVARRLSIRQVQRCPYLFSVAPDGFDAGVANVKTPPSREGFPPTHDLLNQAWYKYLSALEAILEVQPFVLGQRFTLADASIYGQFSMNLVDGKANDLLQEFAPRTHAWLCNIRDGGHLGGPNELALSPQLMDLLEVIGQTFIPLMQQNYAAWEKEVASGETLFNEAAFHQGRALYDGELLGFPFRHVVKTFQVSVWQELQNAWQELDGKHQQRLRDLLPDSVMQAFEERA